MSAPGVRLGDEARHFAVDYTPSAAQQQTASTASPVLLPLRAQAEPSPTTGFALAPLFQPVHGRDVSFSSPARASSTQSEDRDGVAPGSKHADNMDVSSQLPSQVAACNSPAEAYDVYVPSLTDKPSLANHDGWQWRKYGEKVVKGNPHPRSYYKCSHVGCGAKKIVERDESGDIISTDYKAAHCHPMPRHAPMRLRTSSGHNKSTQRWTKVEQPLVAAPVIPPAPPSPTPPRGTRSSSRQLLPIPDSLRRDLRRHGSMYDEEDDGDDESGSRACLPPTPPTMATDGPASSFMHEASSSGHALSPAMRLDVLAAYAEEAERQLHEVENASASSDRDRRAPPSDSPGRSHKRRCIGTAAAAATGGPTPPRVERRGGGGGPSSSLRQDDGQPLQQSTSRLDDVTTGAATTPANLIASFGPEDCLRWCRSLVGKQTAAAAVPAQPVKREFDGRDLGVGQLPRGGGGNRANGAVGTPGSYAYSPKAADRQAMPPPPPVPHIVTAQRRIIASENVSDGYRWRKYGQKDLKGSMFPRSYYKCTTVACPARKYVERLPDSSGRLVMTYEHTHSHPPVPGGAGQGDAGIGEGCDEGGSGCGSDSLPASPWSASPRSGLTTNARDFVTLQDAAKQLLPYLPLGGVRLTGDGHLDPAIAESLEAALCSLGLAGQVDVELLVALLQEHSPVPEPAALDASSWDPSTCIMTPRAPGSAAKRRQALEFPALERVT